MISAKAQAVRSHLPTILVLAAGILWSFSDVLIKAIQWDFFRVAGTRSLIGGVIQFAYLAFKDLGLGGTDKPRK